PLPHPSSFPTRRSSDLRRTNMLTRCLSVSVASSLHSIPSATCSHSGSDQRGGGGGTGSFPVSSAIRSAKRACSDVVGRNTSVGRSEEHTSELQTRRDPV